MTHQLITANLNKLRIAAGDQAPAGVEAAITAANCYLGAACPATPGLTADQAEQVIDTLDCYNNGRPEDFEGCTGLTTTDWPSHCP